MALPLINDAPKYELIIPSTKEKIKFRPFLVKEQKNLLIAYESKDANQIMHAMLDCVGSCCEGVDAYKLSTFDVDYMFTQVRAKSVGETTELAGICSECQRETPIVVDISKIELKEGSVKDNIIEITDKISIKMKYPTYTDFMNTLIINEELTPTQAMLGTVVSCIESVMTEEENISIKDEPKEEIEKFIDSLTSTQFEKIMEFIDGIPKLVHEQKFNCSSCGQENILKLEGLQDFFS